MLIGGLKYLVLSTKITLSTLCDNYLAYLLLIANINGLTEKKT